MWNSLEGRRLVACGWGLGLVMGVSGCNSDGTPVLSVVEEGEEETVVDAPTSAAPSCEEAAAKFVTLGSANVDLPDPLVSASCQEDTMTVSANGIPDFPYIATSPGVPAANLVEYTIPAIPMLAPDVTAIPIVGSIGVAVNGVPIYGPTEGPGGDVLSRPGGFVECGGHNGPTGYHYHIFDVNGSDVCRFSESDVADGPILFGYAFDGYPIYSGNTQYTSSWYLEDESLFATDTWSAHAYVAGSGDLDECNGRTDEDGNYAYFTTDTFPYIMGCFRGVVETQSNGAPDRPEG